MHKSIQTLVFLLCLIPLFLTAAVPGDSLVAWNFGARLDQPLTCANANDGILRITGVPGFSRAQYSIDGEHWQNYPVFRGLAAGTFNPRILFEDGNLFKLAPVEVTSPQPLRLRVSLSPDTLGGQQLTLAAEGGRGQVWFSVDGEESSAQTVRSVEGSGRHVVLAEDEEGCFARTEIWVGGD